MAADVFNSLDVLNMILRESNSNIFYANEKISAFVRKVLGFACILLVSKNKSFSGGI